MKRLLAAVSFLLAWQATAMASTPELSEIDTLFNEWRGAQTPGLAIKVSKAQQTIY